MRARPSAIEALAANPPASGLVVDFDGVLSPIVADAAASAMSADVAATFGRLAKRLGLLAVISGRPLAFLRERVRVEGVPLLGSYGMEQLRDGAAELDPAAGAWLDQVRAAQDTLTAHFAGWPGILIEQKSVSVGVHWRQAADQDAAAAEVRRATARIAAETGLRAEPGKLVEELRPPIDIDKGSSVTALLAREQLSAVAYAGDDLGDIPALLAIREAGGYALVVDHGSETAARLLALADQTFPGTDGFARWLSELADAAGA
jgi:trehalose 6-phosphate phosphatase